MAHKKGLLGPQKVLVKKHAQSKRPAGSSSGLGQADTTGAAKSKRTTTPHAAKPKSSSPVAAKHAQQPVRTLAKAAPKGAHPNKGATSHASSKGKQGPPGHGGAPKAGAKKAGTLFSSGPAVRVAHADSKQYSKVHRVYGDREVRQGSVHKKDAKRRRKAPKSAENQATELQALLPELTKPAATVELEAQMKQPAGGQAARVGASNWARMKAFVASSDAAAKQKADSAAGAAEQKRRRLDRQGRERREALARAQQLEALSQAQDGVRDGRLVAKSDDMSHTKVLAMDCEMVGVGVESKRSALARVCVINDHGNVLLDLYVKSKEKITDYRTRWSGIRPADLHDAATLEEAMQRVHDLLKGHIVVGHALHNDFKVLMLEGVVPHHDIRDTSVYEPLMSAAAAGRKLRSRGLKVIAKEELNLDIQAGEHSPVDDSRAALYIFHKHRAVWEAGLRSGSVRSKTLKNAAKIAVGAKRMKAPRATEISMQPLPAAVVDDDDEFARPSREAVARMQSRMNDTSKDIYADL